MLKECKHINKIVREFIKQTHGPISFKSNFKSYISKITHLNYIGG